MRRQRHTGPVRSIITNFVSHLRSGRPWIDAHLPLVPMPVRSDRPALPNQPSQISTSQRGEHRPNRLPHDGGLVDRSDLIRGAS